MGSDLKRFDRLLKRMAEGEPASAKKSASSDQASDAEQPACSSDTQVGILLKDVSGGRALRAYRGDEVLSPDDAGPPRLQRGDMIIEIVPKERA